MSDTNPKAASPAPASIPAPDAAGSSSIHEPAVGAEQQAASSIQHTDESSAPSYPPPFEPFFTLLTNTTTGSTIHPRVQYLFSDDDTSILANNPDRDPDHRALVVDLAPAPDNTSWSVSWASSLSPDFALTSSHVAVQHDDNNNDDKSTMLRLEGVERDAVESSRGGSRGGSRPASLPSSASGAALGTPGAPGRVDLDSLAEEFKRRLGVLKKVVGESEKRRQIMAEQAASSSGGDVAVEGESPGERGSAVQESLRAGSSEAVGSNWG
ncbi:hypothetical protein QQS21_004812 [Conoideocrella luteorostrata]|uniref:Uncharacterized protein n=1 Tax=Conoideocrella luteorostrata TaxID=1105319 RepID=A0AAJ0CQU4_9HYPO|nr:hypothetical protein QQS21_004812 [Conoideocrella luteorostrata]